VNELEVVKKAHKFLKKNRLFEQTFSRIFTDPHPTLVNESVLKPFQRFTIDMKDFAAHPDIVGQLTDGETLIAVEAKGETDLLKGLAQAELYQVAFHGTLLAADSAKLNPSFVEYARQKGVGVLSVGDGVSLTHPPELRMPRRNTYRFVARQLESTIQVTSGNTFALNIPTHYLAWSIFLTPGETIIVDPQSPPWGSYPMPDRTWKGALRGARKLGLVTAQGAEVSLTQVGAAVKAILPDLDTWTKTHQIVGKPANKTPLVKHSPCAAAVLRLLLLRDPIVELVIQGLKRFSKGRACFSELAQECDKLDHARTPIFFLHPRSAVELADNHGRLDWSNAQGEHYRSTSFFQHKSILKHAGILAANTKLGGSSAKNYDPNADVWELA
jgi:hypothetical protein